MDASEDDDRAPVVQSCGIGWTGAEAAIVVAAQGTGRLTTHVLDTMHGRPAHGVRIDLFGLEGHARELMVSTETGADGRCDGPLLEGEHFRPGTYELVFHVGDYFAAAGITLPEPRFLDAVPVRVGIASAGQHYHVPLLISPYGYSTYRGS